VYDLLAEMSQYSNRFQVYAVERSRPDLQRKALEALRGKEAKWDFIYVVLPPSGTEEVKFKDIYIGDTYRGDTITGKLEAFRAEEMILSSIMELVEPRKTILYCTQGHQELQNRPGGGGGACSEALAHLSQRLNVETRPLMRFKEVPADADMVALLGPRTNLTSEEVDALRSYLERGGRLFLALNWRSDGGVDEKLKGLLVDFNIEISGNLLQFVDERGQPLGIPTQEGTRPLLDAYGIPKGGHTINRYLEEVADFVVTLPNATPVTTQGVGRGGRRGQELLMSAMPAVPVMAEDIPRFLTRGLEGIPTKEGPAIHSVAVAVERKKEDFEKEEVKEWRIVVWGSSFALEDVFMLRSFVHREYWSTCAKWLLGEENRISLPSRTDEREPLVMKPEERTRLHAVTVFLFPTVGIVLGILAWLGRRK
jgi:hypothetical protein